MKRLLAVATGTGLGVQSVPAWAQGFAEGPGGWHGMWGGGGIGTIVLMLYFGSLVLVPIILTIRWLVTTRARGGQADEPFEILKRRYALSELSREQYAARRQDLRP